MNLEIVSILDLGASAPPSQALQKEKGSNTKSFIDDMKKAVNEVQRPRQDRQTKSEKSASEPKETNTSKTESKKDEGGEMNVEPEATEENDVALEELSAMQALFVPIVNTNAQDDQEIAPQGEENLNIEDVTVQDNALELFEDLSILENNTTDAKEATSTEAEFVEQAIGEIKLAVESNEAERTVVAEPDENVEQDARIIDEAQGEYDKNINLNEKESVSQDTTDQEEGLSSEQKANKLTEKPEQKTSEKNTEFNEPPIHKAPDIKLPEAQVAVKDGVIAPQQAQTELFTTIVEQVQSAVNENQSELFIKLKPDVLGGLMIKLVMNNDGLSAQVKTTNQELQTLVNSQLNQLEANLKSRGIDVISMDVIYDNSAGNGYLDQRNEGRFDQGPGNRHSARTIIGKIEESLPNAPYERLYESMSDMENEEIESIEYSA